MEKSDDITELAVALAKTQAQLKRAEENSYNPFIKKNYADLGDVWDACRKPLTDNGLSLSQFPTGGEDGEIGLTTILMHNSGQWIADTIYLQLFSEKGKSAAQVAGSVISYFRRYALSAVVGVVTGEDDDGAMGGAQDKRGAASPQAQRKRQRPAAPNGNDQPFYGTVVKKHKYYNHANHVKSTGELLGLQYPQTGQEAALQLEVYGQYAQLRADGVEQDDAVAQVKGETEPA